MFVVTCANNLCERKSADIICTLLIGVATQKYSCCEYWCDRCPALAAKLDAEKPAQASHVKRIKSKLREIKGSLFNNQRDMHAENVDVSA